MMKTIKKILLTFLSVIWRIIKVLITVLSFVWSVVMGVGELLSASDQESEMFRRRR